MAQIGFTPLHTAASNNRAEVAQLLLDRGAGVDAKDFVRSCPYAVWLTPWAESRALRCVPGLAAIAGCVVALAERQDAAAFCRVTWSPGRCEDTTATQS